VFFLQLLRFLSNELRLAFVGVGVPEARHALLSDSQLRSRFTDIELPPWSLGDDLRDFVTRLTWSLPLRNPSPVDSPKLRCLLGERTGGITLGICKAFERAAVAAIRDGRERLDLASFEAPDICAAWPVPAGEHAVKRMGSWRGNSCDTAASAARAVELPSVFQSVPLV
jgi:hypothetical protein